MSRVALSGYYGFNNLGDEAVLAATVDALRARCPGVELAVLSANPHATSRTYRVHGIPRDRPWDLVQALRGCDLCLSGGGSLFQDATSWRSPWYYLGILALAQRLGCRTAVYAQGIGPLRGRMVRSATRRCLDATDLITLRDQDSLTLLAALGVARPPVALAADPALLLTPQWSEEVLAEQAQWGEGGHFGLALRSWKDARALETITTAARTIAARLGVRWVCVPMHPPQDLAVAEQAASRIGPGARVLRVSLGPREMLALFDHFQLVVGMRLHALMFAAMQGVPVVSVAYDPKVSAFARELGEPCLDAAHLDVEPLVHAIEAAASHLAARRARLLAAVAPLRARAALAPHLVANLLP
jgi:polysaccharide pyruvyl transferase CsaB